MIMSNNWKKRVSDFFFEEIEEEIVQEIEASSDNTVQRTPPTSKRSVDTRVAYQYSKKRPSSFRFPVTVDEQDNQTNNRTPRSRQQAHNKKRRRPYNQAALNKRERQPTDKELEDIPAYMRRENNRGNTQAKQEVVKKPEQNIVEQAEDKKTNPLEGYTRPDELDRVFRIRDGHDKHEEREKEDLEKKRKQAYFDRTARREKIEQLKHRVEQEDVEIEEETPSTMVQEETTKLEPNYDEVEQFDESESIHVTPELSMVEEEMSSEEDVYIPTVPNYLLDDPVLPDDGDSDWLQEQQFLLNQTLEHFKVDAKVVNVTQGPSVTRFEIQPALGVKVSRIRNLADDIKLNMSARDIRMEAPIPGKNTIGIEVPNQYPQVVSLQEIIESEAFDQSDSDLTIALGLTIEGEPLITTIDDMPHGLIAGATGSGKSVCINSIILSVLYKANHEDVKFMMIDPKMVELTPYNGIPHLISPVITDAQAATVALKWAVDEMEERYEKLANAGVRNVQRYNEKMIKENRASEKLPYIVVIIDELADLMIVSPQEVEDAICRIAQKARACGMHLLVATQRPSVDVITGLIKANIPTRIAFSVSSQVDSRTILDANGAEKLLGKGDMLFVENGASKSVRLQGPFVSDDEIDRVANYSRQIAEPNYLFEQEQLLLEVENEDEDELLDEVISFVVEQRRASTSLLQRRFRIGYNRAARLIDSLEFKGIVSAANGSKPRDVLVTKAQIEEALQ